MSIIFFKHQTTQSSTKGWCGSSNDMKEEKSAPSTSVKVSGGNVWKLYYEFHAKYSGRQRREKTVRFACGSNPEESHRYQDQTQPKALCVGVTKKGVGVLSWLLFFYHYPYCWCRERLLNGLATDKEFRLKLETRTPGAGTKPSARILGGQVPAQHRAAVCSELFVYCLPWGQGRAGGACFRAELRVLEDEDPGEGARDVSEGNPQGSEC